MHRKWLAAVLLGTALASPVAIAQATTPDAAPDRLCIKHPDFSLVEVLDPNAPLERRTLQAQRLLDLASDPRCGEGYQYFSAHLFRHGDELPGNTVPRDLDRARILLEQAGARGQHLAYAELAELGLAVGNAREAMQWTQVFLTLGGKQASANRDFDLRGYNADLLLRASKAWDQARIKGGRSARSALLNEQLRRRTALIAQLEAEPPVEEDAEAESPGAQDRGFKLKSGSLLQQLGRPLLPGYAIFLLEVQPDGTVSRVVTEAFGPTAAHGEVLRTRLDGFEFHPIGGDRPRIVRIPVVTGYASGGPKLRH